MAIAARHLLKDSTVILEAIVTTINDDDSTNISPMGPEVSANIDTFVLKPFKTSTTYRNLKRHSEGVLHITDDVMMLAQSAVGQIDPAPTLISATSVKGRILANACRWFAFSATKIDDDQERTSIDCEVIDRGTIREFFGFNRGKHAVLELAILATRLHILEHSIVRTEMEKLFVLVEKTGGPQEQEAFEFLRRYIDEHMR